MPQEYICLSVYDSMQLRIQERDGTQWNVHVTQFPRSVPTRHRVPLPVLLQEYICISVCLVNDNSEMTFSASEGTTLALYKYAYYYC